MVRKPESTKGTQKGKNKLDLPNNAALNQMTDDELVMTLTQLRSLEMTMKANESRGLLPPGGNMKEIKRGIARILTLQNKRKKGEK